MRGSHVRDYVTLIKLPYIDVLNNFLYRRDRITSKQFLIENCPDIV
jgi:hypothetical protein